LEPKITPRGIKLVQLSRIHQHRSELIEAEKIVMKSSSQEIITSACWGLNVSSGFPVGTILPYAGAEAPHGWLLCDGATLDLTNNPQHTRLATMLRKPNLPDLRGKFLMGSDATHALGSTLGNKSMKLGIPHLPPHNHSGVTLSGNPIFYRTVDPHNSRTGLNTDCNHVTGWHNGSYKDYTDSNYPVSGHTHNIPIEGGGEAFDLIPPTMAVNYIIKW